MAVLHVTLFGCPRFSDEERGTEIKLTRTIQALLAYLLVERKRTHSREVLANLFWSDYPQNRAQASLNTALWRLRCAIEAHSPPDAHFLLLNQQGEIAFNGNSSYWLDIEDFENLTDRLPAKPEPTITPAAVQRAEQAVQLYRGDLLEGFYEDWVLRERERLRNRYLACLAYLMFASQKLGNPNAALGYGQKILNEEPLSEETHRAVMRLYYQMGQRALAVRQYETCRQILKTELGIDPMPETTMLFQRMSEPAVSIPTTGDKAALGTLLHALEQNNPAPTAAWATSLQQVIENLAPQLPPSEIEPLRQILQHLREALDLSDSVRQQIQQAIQKIEKYLL